MIKTPKELRALERRAEIRADINKAFKGITSKGGSIPFSKRLSREGFRVAEEYLRLFGWACATTVSMQEVCSVCSAVDIVPLVTYSKEEWDMREAQMVLELSQKVVLSADPYKPGWVTRVESDGNPYEELEKEQVALLDAQATARREG